MAKIQAITCHSWVEGWDGWVSAHCWQAELLRLVCLCSARTKGPFRTGE